MADVYETIEAVGCLSTPVRKLVELVAETAAFQRRCNVPDQAAAIARIHHPHLRVASLDQLLRPAAVISTKSFALSRRDTRFLRPDDPTLELLITDDDRYPDKSDWSQIDFENFAGEVIREIAELQGVDTRLPIGVIRQVVPASISHLRTAGQRRSYWVTIFDVVWSPL